MIVVFEVAISSELFFMTLHTVQARQYSLTPVGIEGTRLNPENGLRIAWLSIQLANKPRNVGSIPTAVKNVFCLHVHCGVTHCNISSSKIHCMIYMPLY